MDVWQICLALSLLLVFFAVGVWDVYALSQGQIHSTVSSLLTAWAGAYPILPFAVGVLIGHLFWK